MSIPTATLFNLGRSRICTVCGSRGNPEYRGEIRLDLCGGLETTEKPSVSIVAPVCVCLDCGSAQFTVPYSGLEVIRTEPHE